MNMLVGRKVRTWVLGLALLAGGGGGALGEAQAGTTDDLMDTTKHPVSVTMAMQADSFFGFNPSIYGTYGLTDNIALAFNFTYWTMINGVGVHDNAPWLETDMGLNFTFLDKRLSVTPMTVSYTHLDVYKRQASSMGRPLRSGWFMRPTWPGTSAIVAQRWLLDCAHW